MINLIEIRSIKLLPEFQKNMHISTSSISFLLSGTLYDLPNKK